MKRKRGPPSYHDSDFIWCLHHLLDTFHSLYHLIQYLNAALSEATFVPLSCSVRRDELKPKGLKHEEEIRQFDNNTASHASLDG